MITFLSFEGFIGLGPSLEGYDKKWRVFASRSRWASLEGIKELLNCREAAYLNISLQRTGRGADALRWNFFGPPLSCGC